MAHIRDENFAFLLALDEEDEDTLVIYDFKQNTVSLFIKLVKDILPMGIDPTKGEVRLLLFFSETTVEVIDTQSLQVTEIAEFDESIYDVCINTIGE